MKKKLFLSLCLYNMSLRPDFLISTFTNPPTVIFQKVEKKNISNFFYPPTLNSICFVEKKILRFCLCNFESGAVKVIVLCRI